MVRCKFVYLPLLVTALATTAFAEDPAKCHAAMNPTPAPSVPSTNDTPDAVMPSPAYGGDSGNSDFTPDTPGVPSSGSNMIPDDDTNVPDAVTPSPSSNDDVPASGSGMIPDDGGDFTPDVYAPSSSGDAEIPGSGSGMIPVDGEATPLPSDGADTPASGSDMIPDDGEVTPLPSYGGDSADSDVSPDSADIPASGSDMVPDGAEVTPSPSGSAEVPESGSGIIPDDSGVATLSPSDGAEVPSSDSDFTPADGENGTPSSSDDCDSQSSDAAPDSPEGVEGDSATAPNDITDLSESGSNMTPEMTPSPTSNDIPDANADSSCSEEADESNIASESDSFGSEYTEPTDTSDEISPTDDDASTPAPSTADENSEEQETEAPEPSADTYSSDTCNVCVYKEENYGGESYCMEGRDANGADIRAVQHDFPEYVSSIKFNKDSEDCDLSVVFKITVPPFDEKFEAFNSDCEATGYDMNIVQKMYVEKAGTVCLSAANEVGKMGMCFTESAPSFEKAYQDAFFEVIMFEGESDDMSVTLYTEEDYEGESRTFTQTAGENSMSMSSEYDAKLTTMSIKSKSLKISNGSGDSY